MNQLDENVFMQDEIALREKENQSNGNRWIAPPLIFLVSKKPDDVLIL